MMYESLNLNYQLDTIRGKIKMLLKEKRASRCPYQTFCYELFFWQFIVKILFKDSVDIVR
jgi:hypothetical protein